MISSSPITPPPELRRQWLDNDHFPMVTGTNDLLSITRDRLRNVMDQAAQWGADQELEACVEWLGDAPVVYNDNGDLHPGSYLRDARRPKPPSLKESALNALEHILRHSQTDHGANTIRRALEALPND
jgi:hypothetical protein